MEKTKGFITIATGKEEYYSLAANLLRSYRMFTENQLPFALLCDRENEYTADFDDVIVFSAGATNSYLDKLSLGDYIPYDETVFVDADCLAYGDLNSVFDYFQNADDFSCFGRVLPLDDKTGWFEYENLGAYQSEVSYIVGLHGGIYYMRKGSTVNAVFDKARALVPEYASFKFKGKFNTPGDEPLVALSMALNNCHPVPFAREAICCYWEYVGNMDIDISVPKANIVSSPTGKTNLVHWGTRYTRETEYKKQIELLSLVEENAAENEFVLCRKKFNRIMQTERRNRFFMRVINKIKRIWRAIIKD